MFTRLVSTFFRSLLVVAFATTPLRGHAQAVSDTGAAVPLSPLHARLSSPVLAGLRWPNIQDVSVDVARAYERVNWEPLWNNGGQLKESARAVVRLLTNIDSLGLNPADFDAPLLDSLAAAAATGAPDAVLLVQLEATLSVATARLLAALRWGRARQPRAYPTLPRSRDGFDLGEGLYAVSITPDPIPVFDQAAPQWTPYRQLLAVLPTARRAAGDSVLMALPATRGSRFASAPRLRRLLGSIGFPADSLAPHSEADTSVDGSLSAALLRFQKTERLAQTGSYDAATRDRLGGLLRGRVVDAVLSLERWRWLPRTGDGRAIVVNVPEFRLRVYDDITDTDAPAFGMKVVVGRGEKKRFTPLFSDHLEHLIFSPFWEVPKSIAVTEIVPRIHQDSTYLSRNRYVLVQSTSDSARALPVDSATVARIGRSVRVRQLPGDYNSMGRIKFMLPNDLNIYLHDTNEKQFFKRDVRALSHGCIRVAEPVRLAEWILGGDTTWTPERMKRAMKQEKPEVVQLHSRIPVLIVYHTASVDEAGVLRSFRDVYQYNKELELLLSRGFPPPR